jgi:Lrp/AsnC family transcriptional regulator for asnA, asnC and gidA
MVILLATAYLLLNVETGSEEEVMRSLNPIQEVSEAQMVYGIYDIIIRVETETMAEMKDLVNGRIRRLYRVRSTMTMIVV